MRLLKTLLGAALAAPFALAACGDEAGSFEVELVHLDCDTRQSVLPASKLELRVSGDDMDDVVVKNIESGARSTDLSDVPAGTNRVVTLTAYDTATGLDVLAVGRSQPFDLVAGESVTVKVPVHATNRFITAAELDGNACAQLAQPRAGHSAVRMADGRVLIFGGASRIGNAVLPEAFVETAEIFDPATGTFEPAKAPCDGSVCWNAINSQAVLLKDGRVAAFGGETVDQGVLVPVSGIAIYNPENGGSWDLSRSMKTPRRGHTATLVPETGMVLIVGGIGPGDAVLQTTELFQPSTGATTDGPVLEAVDRNDVAHAAGRANHVAVLVAPNRVAIAGGIDSERHMAGSVRYITVAGGTATVIETTLAMWVPTWGAAGAALGRGGIVLAGGYPTPTRDDNAVGYAQWYQNSVGTEPKNQARLESPRAGACAVTLDDNRVLFVGGLTNVSIPVPSAEMAVLSGDSLSIGYAGGDSQATSVARNARALGTCTNLGDGRVLIVGGLVDSNDATGKAEFYTAKPRT